jgi:UDP-N-acetylglucosamine acyltransferase
MSNIHPTAIIEPGAKIGKNVTIEPYAIIKGNVTLEDDVVIKSHAYIDGNTTIGQGTTVWPSASIGTRTQDKKFYGETTYVKIGKNCHIREFVTINSSCQENSVVSVGDDCLIMAYCHVAHNCTLGNGVIMANNAMLAGHVTVGNYVVIGGMTPVHQFVRIGDYSMVGGFSRVTHDIPPYTIGAGTPYEVGGLNLVGLKRHNFSYDQRKYLTKAFKITYRSGLRLQDAVAKIQEENEVDQSEDVAKWIDFCLSTKRGLIGLAGITQKYEEESQDPELVAEKT